jgi:recombination protein RecR
MNVLDQLIKQLSRIPGIGIKSATRIAYFLLKSDTHYVRSLARSIDELQDKIQSCSVCGNYTMSDPCSICSDSGRERATICVVEQPQDLAVIESTREYQGLYHVLQGVISPLDGVGPEDLRITSLISRIHEGGVREVILATNPTVEGDTTALYLVDLLKKQSVKISRLALGLPIGGDLEYADRLTLTRALQARTAVE